MDLRKLNLDVTFKMLQSAFTEDYLIVQAVRAIEDLEISANMLSKRLRDWYEVYNPEFSSYERNHEAFVKRIIRTNKKELLNKMKISESVGSDISKEDLKAIRRLAFLIHEIYESKAGLQKYLECRMQEICPNIKAVAGPLVGSKLLARAGSLKEFSRMPASKIQVLGAEKALFRHLKDKKHRPPKYGILHEHELVQGAKNKGKIARAIADKLSIAAKVDYFKGEFIGSKLRKEIEEKLL